MAQNIPLPMMGAFNFDGKSSLDFGLVCRTVARPAVSPVKFRRVEAGTRSGAYDFPSINYELRTVSTQIQFIGNFWEENLTPGHILENINNPNHVIQGGVPQSFYELRSRFHEIAGWLCKPEWKILSFTDDPDKYFLAKLDGEISVDELERMALGSAELSFICQPLMYGNKETLSFSGPGSYLINNIGTYPISFSSQLGSIFTIQLSNIVGSCGLTLNNKTLTISGDISEILIDVIDTSAKLLPAGDNGFKYLSGSIDKFIQLNPGSNTLQVTGSVGDIVVSFTPLFL